MRRDELLEICEDGFNETNGTFLARAIRRVVELHKPIETRPPWGGDKYFACNVCEVGTNDGDYKLDYPCETIQAIESELL
jgi:hypothetical protein